MNCRVLQRLHLRVSGWLALRAALGALALIGLASLAALLCDATLDLSEATRAGAPWFLAAVLVAAWGGAIWEWRRLGEERLARMFEHADPALAIA